MKRVINTGLAGIGGTTVMTLFSYGLGRIVKDNFNEPEHLTTLINRLPLPVSSKMSRVIGWSLHYTVGLLFTIVYTELWENQKLHPDVKNTVALGGLSGALAVAVWKSTLKLHPLPPWINYRRYYMQLVPAHVIFALGTMATYKLVKQAQMRRNTTALIDKKDQL